MLGWEFPPFISGGLGAACHGLTRSLGRLGIDVTFVLPKAIGEEHDTHVKLLTPQSPEAAAGSREPEAVASTFRYEHRSETPSKTDFTPPAQLADHAASRGEAEAFEHVEFKAVPSRLPSPYPGGEAMWTGQQPTGISYLGPRGAGPVPPPEPSPSGEGQPPEPDPATTGPESASKTPSEQAIYAGDLFGETHRYADLCRDLARGVEFDAIHAHDWPTFPAAAAVADETGKPLILHVHSTEFDRSGEYVHQQIYEIERAGMHRADAIIAVSQLTANLLTQRYGVPHDKITVIYNGIENGPQLPGDADTSTVRVEKDDKVVLYLGRVTHQKGPEYFVAAAKRVLEKIDNVKFVVAGSGDRIKQCIELAAREGI
ncbi:MAG: glycosyltransferase, partial [Phycisphaeraceae bacterium]